MNVLIKPKVEDKETLIICLISFHFISDNVIDEDNTI